MPEGHATSLQIDQDLTLQHRSWKVQRAGWVLMALFVLAAAFGLFGSGMASRATAGGMDAPVRLEYARFGRWLAPVEMRLLLREQDTGSARVWMSAEYIESYKVEAIAPEPESTEVGGDGLIYTFRVSPGQPATVTFHLTPEHFGPRSGEVGIVGAPPLHFQQFIFP